jgi:hypothetical protein
MDYFPQVTTSSRFKRVITFQKPVDRSVVYDQLAKREALWMTDPLFDYWTDCD